MRKLLISEMITLDGFFAGPNGEIDWHVVDDDFNRFADEQLKSVDTLIFGRVTYQLMADYWPTPAALSDDPIIARQMNDLAKVVFSETLAKADWQNTRLVRGNMAQEISKLKQQSGKDMVIFGSGTVVQALAQAGLIDEYRIIVAPVLLGQGKSLFSGVSGLNLKLLRTKTLACGDVILFYEPKQ